MQNQSWSWRPYEWRQGEKRWVIDRLNLKRVRISWRIVLALSCSRDWCSYPRSGMWPTWRDVIKQEDGSACGTREEMLKATFLRSSNSQAAYFIAGYVWIHSDSEVSYLSVSSYLVVSLPQILYTHIPWLRLSYDAKLVNRSHAVTYCTQYDLVRLERCDWKAETTILGNVSFEKKVFFFGMT